MGRHTYNDPSGGRSYRGSASHYPDGDDYERPNRQPKYSSFNYTNDNYNPPMGQDRMERDDYSKPRPGSEMPPIPRGYSSNGRSSYNGESNMYNDSSRKPDRPAHPPQNQSQSQRYAGMGHSVEDNYAKNKDFSRQSNISSRRSSTNKDFDGSYHGYDDRGLSPHRLADVPEDLDFIDSYTDRDEPNPPKKDRLTRGNRSAPSSAASSLRSSISAVSRADSMISHFEEHEPRMGKRIDTQRSAFFTDDGGSSWGELTDGSEFGDPDDAGVHTDLDSVWDSTSDASGLTSRSNSMASFESDFTSNEMSDRESRDRDRWDQKRPTGFAETNPTKDQDTSVARRDTHTALSSTRRAQRAARTRPTTTSDPILAEPQNLNRLEVKPVVSKDKSKPDRAAPQATPVNEFPALLKNAFTSMTNAFSGLSTTASPKPAASLSQVPKNPQNKNEANTPRQKREKKEKPKKSPSPPMFLDMKNMQEEESEEEMAPDDPIEIFRQEEAKAKRDSERGRNKKPALTIHQIRAELMKEFRVPLRRDRTEEGGVVIIGGGAAGFNCAEELRANKYQGRILLLSKENCLPYDRTTLSKSRINTSNTEDLYLKQPEFYRDKKIEVRLNTEIVSVDVKRRVISTFEGARVSYEKLVIAVGSKPKTFDVPGSRLEGVFNLQSITDAQTLDKEIADMQTALGPELAPCVVIVGSGLLGMELATCLGRTTDVTIISRSVAPFESLLGTRVGEALVKFDQKYGREYRLSTTIKEIRASEFDPRRVGSVVTSTGEIIDADFVVSAIGSKPATAFLKKSGILERNGSVIVDRRFRVSKVRDGSVFAVGDIAAFPPVKNDDTTIRLAQWTNAVNHGRAAAAIIANVRPLGFNRAAQFWISASRQLRYVGLRNRMLWESVIIRGDLENLKFIAYFTLKDEVVAVASMQSDPIVQHCIELIREEKMPTATQIRNKLDPLKIETESSKRKKKEKENAS